MWMRFGRRKCDKHMLSPTLTLDEALRRVAVWDDAGSSAAGGSRTRESSLIEQASGHCQDASSWQ